MRVVCMSHMCYSNHRTGETTRLGRRVYCIFYILLTFAPDTVRSLVLSECRQKVWRFRGERQDRGPWVGSQVLYFFARRRLWLRLRRCSVRPVCGPERTESGTSSDPRVPRALLSSLICDSTHLWPVFRCSPLLFEFYDDDYHNFRQFGIISISWNLKWHLCHFHWYELNIW